MKHICHKILVSIALSLCLTNTLNAEDVWALVTDISELSIGDTVIIVARNENYAMSTQQNTNNRGRVAIKKDGDFCLVDTVQSSNYELQQFTLKTGKINNTYALYTGDGYLYAASSKDGENWLRTETELSKNSSWEITISPEKTKIVSVGGFDNNEIRHNNSSALFSCYFRTSEQPSIVLYKLIDSKSLKDCTITLSIDGETETHTHRVGRNFTFPSNIHAIEGLEFLGWSTTPMAIGATESVGIIAAGESVNITDSITFYAVYGKKEEVSEPAYIKIENEQTDWSGTYLIVCESQGVVFDGSRSNIDSTLNYKKISISNNKIESNNVTDAMTFTISSITNGYSVRSKSGLYIGNTQDKNLIETSTEKAILNTISYNADNGVYIKGSKKATDYAIRYYYSKNGSRFRYYSYSNSLPIQLYKLNQTSSAYAYYTTCLNIEVTANKYGYSTWYSAVPVSIPEGLKAYYCTIEGETAALHPINGVIPSFTGAILYSEEAAQKQEAKSYTMSYTTGAAPNISGNRLIGFTKDTYVDNGKAHYALNVRDSKVGFYIPQTAEEVEGEKLSPESPFTAKAGKAYLSKDPNETAAAYAIKRIDDTDVISVTTAPSQSDTQIYDLFGRPVELPHKGIYIINGKKVVL